jgi:hypothetical protein
MLAFSGVRRAKSAESGGPSFPFTWKPVFRRALPSVGVVLTGGGGPLQKLSCKIQADSSPELVVGIQCKCERCTLS